MSILQDDAFVDGIVNIARMLDGDAAARQLDRLLALDYGEMPGDILEDIRVALRELEERAHNYAQKVYAATLEPERRRAYLHGTLWRKAGKRRRRR